MADVFALRLDDASRYHLTRALEAHAVECRKNGHTLPVPLAELWNLARAGQGRTPLGDGDAGPHDAPVLLTYADVGKRLRVSARTVQRLVAAGALPVVVVGSSPRVHYADLHAYAERLRATGRTPHAEAS